MTFPLKNQLIDPALQWLQDQWPSVERQREMLAPLPGWQGVAVNAAGQYANALMMGTTAPAAKAPMPAWYHGTSTKFDGFNTPEVYITDNPGQAAQYAQGVHRPGQSGGGQPAVLPISPKPGQVQNIDDHLFDAMDEGTDLGDAIDQAVSDARKGGQARYLEYTHPNAGDQGDHTVRISLYPQDDLQLGK